MDICIRNPRYTEWTSSVSYVTPAIRQAYVEYKERPSYYREIPSFTREYIVYRPDNNPYLPTYIAHISDVNVYSISVTLETQNQLIVSQEIHNQLENAGKAIPIIDLNDIYVFIVDNPPMNRANWIPASSYQIWAYRDFMYDRHRTIKKSYMSRNTMPDVYEANDRILTNHIVTINVANIASNIVFNISRNENNSVYFERNDTFRTRVRICDNECARTRYFRFYTHLTMNQESVVFTSHELTNSTLLSTTHLLEPEETDNEEHQCILCFRFRINTLFSPCEHQVCCAACYSKLSKNACPVCRAEITRVMNV
jgi:hypothetical protein